MKALLGLMALTVVLAVPIGCGSDAKCPPADGAAFLTPEACEACGGMIIGDPGDGRTHEEDFRCPNGSRSLGSVAYGIEGGACCPK
jgi:hypothetical protein